jgi:hypothetical protein
MGFPIRLDHSVKADFIRLAKPEARSYGSVVLSRYQRSGFNKPVPMRVLEGNWSISPPWCRSWKSSFAVNRAVLARACGWVPFKHHPSGQRSMTHSSAQPPAGPLQLLRAFRLFLDTNTASHVPAISSGHNHIELRRGYP